MADIKKVKIGGVDYDIKDDAARTRLTTAEGSISTLQSDLTAEVSRATTAEGGLGNRITALESKGRYLSTWDATTGKPATYPEISQLVEGKYNYRSGDYYIVNKVAAENNLMPDGAYISYDSATTTWTVPTKAFSGTLSLGDQFQYDGSKWTYIASATTVAFANIQGDADENANLKGKLDELRNGKVSHKSGKSGAAGDLAYKDTASTSYTPAGTIAELDVTPAGTIALNAFTQTATAATLTNASYTPTGSIKVNNAVQAEGNKAIKGGSIAVTLGDTSTSLTDLTYGAYTPAGSVNADSTVAALTSAIFEKVTSSTPGAVQLEATVGIPTITVTAGEEKTFVTGLKGGSVASLGDQSKSKFVNKLFKANVDTTNEVLEFSYVGYDDTSASETDKGRFTDAVTERGTWTANVLQDVNTSTVHDTPTATSSRPTFTGDRYKVSVASDNAIKTASFTGTAENIKLTDAKYLKQAVNTATFTPVECELTFAGVETADVITTAVTYDKATANGATFSGTTKKVTPTFSGTKATITVE